MFARLVKQGMAAVEKNTAAQMQAYERRHGVMIFSCGEHERPLLAITQMPEERGILHGYQGGTHGLPADSDVSQPGAGPSANPSFKVQKLHDCGIESRLVGSDTSGREPPNSSLSALPVCTKLQLKIR